MGVLGALGRVLGGVLELKFEGCPPEARREASRFSEILPKSVTDRLDTVLLSSCRLVAGWFSRSPLALLSLFFQRTFVIHAVNGVLLEVS